MKVDQVVRTGGEPVHEAVEETIGAEPVSYTHLTLPTNREV